MKMQIGIYELEGNYVEYHGGDYAMDVDSGENIPAFFLAEVGEFIETFEEAYERADYDLVRRNL